MPIELADLRRATVAYLTMLTETAAVIVAIGPDAGGLRGEILAALDPSAPGALVRIARELSALLGLATPPPPPPPFRGATTIEERRRLAEG